MKTSLTDAVAAADAQGRFLSSSEISHVIKYVQPSPSRNRQSLPDAISRKLSVKIGDGIKAYTWATGTAPPADAIRQNWYVERQAIQRVEHLLPPVTTPADVVLRQMHDYYYTIPLGLAECYHQLGNYATAQTYYLQAINYKYLNPIEARSLWLKLADLFLDWGDSLYKDGKPNDALAKYQQVLKANFTAPVDADKSPLYSLAPLKVMADTARSLIPQLGQDFSSLKAFNPKLIEVLNSVRSRLFKLNAALDFWGHSLVPIYTFDYLREVATNLTQQAISAERDVINFLDRFQQASLTATQLQHAIAQAEEDISAAKDQQLIAQKSQEVATIAANLAVARFNNANVAIADYTAKSEQWISAEGEVAYWNLREVGKSYDIYARDNTKYAGTFHRDYEVGSLQRTAKEMEAAKQQAQKEQAAATARLNASNSAVQVAEARAERARQLEEQYSSQPLSASVWYELSYQMLKLYRTYLNQAADVARLMEKAYNFENDTDLKKIRKDYSAGNGIVAVGSLAALGAEQLMVDIQSFTFDKVTQRTVKSQPIKRIISLAERYPYQFVTQFRKTGRMTFDTRIEDFDEYYPGTYAGRIEAIEVEIDGLLPIRGISGTLTNNGISAYRVPNSTNLKYRFQPQETLVLSDYNVRTDSLLIQPDQRIMGVFEGAGLASSWTIEIPPAINDINFETITDVRITFYYNAKFDANLAALVKKQLATLPGRNKRQVALPLRGLYPDAFFRFQDTGELTIALDKFDFPFNCLQPKLTNAGVMLVSDNKALVDKRTVRLSTPQTPFMRATTTTNGVLAFGADESWGKMVRSAVGDYSVLLLSQDNPTLVKDGKLDLSWLTNVVLLLSYEFSSPV